MNFLAHAFLSNDNEKLILGNLIADAVKGKMFDNYDIEIKKGIILHRKIDIYTDTHEIVKQSISRLESNYKKYSSVIVDIFYDHFLAVNFHLYSSIPLSLMAKTAYNVLIKNFEILPPKSKKILPYMVNQNWLESYANLTHLQKIFNGMSNRARFESGMENAITDLKNSYPLFENEFLEFFPDLINYSKQQIEILKSV